MALRTIVFVPLVSALHDPGSVSDVITSYRDWLNRHFDKELPPTSDAGSMYALDLEHVTGIIALVVTGGTERLIQSVASFGRPLLILSHESMNSLPAALEALPSLEENRRPEMVFGQDEAGLEKVRRFASAAEVLDRMRYHRIGLVGGPSPWLTYSLPDEVSLSRRLGIKLVQIPMSEFDAEYDAVNRPLAAKMAQEAQSKAPAVIEVKLDDFDRSSRIYVALEALVRKHDLNSLSVRCFDYIGKHKATGCYAISLFNDRGIAAGCEGDIPATVAMVTLGEASGSPTFLANPTYINGHKLVLAHCTIAPKLTSKFQYRTHFESGLGVAISGTLKDGERVTVARFSRDYGILRAGAGVITKGDAWSDKLCRTQAEIKMDGDATVFRDRPLGNHLVMTYGDHTDTLHTIASLAGIEFEEV
jgi:L-fucose isomerase-like protein